MRKPKPIQVYVEKAEKEAFAVACWQLDTDMSREIRRFIREFNDEFFSKNPDLLSLLEEGRSNAKR